MTKTQAKTNVTNMVTTEESPSFKRKRMLEIRAMVARAVKQNKRVDLMGFEGTDIPRAMIALQDLLLKTQERHQKATKHVAFANQISDLFAHIMDHATENMVENQEKIGELTSSLLIERHEHMKTSSALQDTWQMANDLADDLQTVKRAGSIING